MKVPFFKLGPRYQSIKNDLDNAYQQVFEEQAFGEIPYVQSFEDAFARAQGMKFCSAVASGTSALHLILAALDVGAQHEVIVPSNTCFATAAAVSHAGAKPVFVDCDPYYTLDTRKLQAALTGKTKAIIAVHLYGQPAELDELQEFCTLHKLDLIEDCAQAQFAQYKQQLVGTMGVAASFSFYPTKNLGAFGEAGAVVTNNEKLYQRVQMLKNLGSKRKGEHLQVGFNYRMDGLQAALLKVKLPHVQKWNDHRRMLAMLYSDRLKNVDQVILPQQRQQVSHAYHLFVIRAQRRDMLGSFLERKGVSTLVHYPIPCHRQPAYRDQGYAGHGLPCAELYAQEVLSLPLSEQHAPEEIAYTAEKIIEFYQDNP